MLRALILLASTLLSAPALAQDAPAEDAPAQEPVEEVDAPDPDVLLDGYSPEVRAAADAWVEALDATPRLVSLQAQPTESQDLTEELQARLKLLGEKTFSNREWKDYWHRQATTAGALADALQAAGGPTHRVEATRAWATLAADKLTNQDRFFQAIESERDALEFRLEAALDVSEVEQEPKVELTDPNPYEERRMLLEDFEDRIESQERKLVQVRAEVRFIERQLASEEILGGALQTDLELARRELEIASSQAGVADAWQQLWAGVAARATSKVAKIASEYEYGQASHRAREVELGLALSQIEYRDGRIDTLQAQLDEASSPVTLLSATWDTLLQWLSSSAWKVVIGLLLVYIGVRLAQRLLDRVVRYILQKADDDPDVDDEGDQRRQTLADVFTSVARIAIFILAGLLALEQIGINTGPLLGSVAILGLAISFGSQNLVRDLVNGFFILLENQYAVEDVVTLGGNTGTVERITIRSTWIRGYDGNMHVIPNGTISSVTNHTREWSRAVCDIGVAYDTDLEKVREIIDREGLAMYAEEEWSEALEEAPCWVGVTSLGDSAVVVRAHVRVDAGQQWAVNRELNRRLKVAFDREGIEIPFPQVVMHQAPAE